MKERGKQGCRGMPMMDEMSLNVRAVRDELESIQLARLISSGEKTL
jgi:hypothetical protein